MQPILRVFWIQEWDRYSRQWVNVVDIKAPNAAAAALQWLEGPTRNGFRVKPA